MIPFSHNNPCWHFSIDKSIRPSLSIPGCVFCRELKIVPVYQVVLILVEGFYPVSSCQERRVEEGKVY